MAKSKTVGILVAKHFQYSVSSVFILFTNEETVIVLIYICELTM